MKAKVDPETKSVIYDIEIEGDLAEEVQGIIASNNPALQAIPFEEDPAPEAS